MIIVLINATIAAVTENNANDALEALSSLQSPISNVIRGGEEVQVESKDLVRGDIVKLGTGDVVPADVRRDPARLERFLCPIPPRGSRVAAGSTAAAGPSLSEAAPSASRRARTWLGGLARARVATVAAHAVLAEPLLAGAAAGGAADREDGGRSRESEGRVGPSPVTR